MTKAVRPSPAGILDRVFANEESPESKSSTSSGVRSDKLNHCPPILQDAPTAASLKTTGQIVYLEANETHGQGEPYHHEYRGNIEVLLGCTEGAVFIVGWIDDTSAPLKGLRLETKGWTAYVQNHAIARLRRRDVEESLSYGGTHGFGFWTLVSGDGPLTLRFEATICIELEDGSSKRLEALRIRSVSASEVRDVALSYFAKCDYHGSSQVEGMRQLDGGLGNRLIEFNRSISRTNVARPYVRRFLSTSRRPKASIVVCLFGKIEFLFLQMAAFAQLEHLREHYEFVYVSNSPELSEQLVNEAQISQKIYGIDLTLVLLAGNAGFGAANNAAIEYCRSSRILIMNPDVFPLANSWARTHADIIETRGKVQTKIFGVPLYYDNGSLMHAGMYFEYDAGLSWNANGIQSRPMLRVEHYAKGAPPKTMRFLQSRPVPAVTGAFMSVDRAWFEALGGFTEDYVFGHYEDADLCLKSLKGGSHVWLHDAPLHHLEGKGSSRLTQHEGGSLVNRWLFSLTWGTVILGRLEGQVPNLEVGVGISLIHDRGETRTSDEISEQFSSKGDLQPSQDSPSVTVRKSSYVR